jgi:hypothetical protein
MSKMHADELTVDSSLVVELLAAQFPHWANFPPSTGSVRWDRLGTLDRAHRFPLLSEHEPSVCSDSPKDDRRSPRRLGLNEA